MFQWIRWYSFWIVQFKYRIEMIKNWKLTNRSIKLKYFEKNNSKRYNGWIKDTSAINRLQRHLTNI